MFSNNLLMAAASASGAGGYEVGNSVRLNDNDSAYMSWTPSGAPDSARIFTFSIWFKRCNLATAQYFTSQDWTASGNNSFNLAMSWLGADALNFTLETNAGAALIQRTLTQSFRDPTSWGHLHIVINTGLTTDACAVVTYNGVVVTAFDTKTNPGSAQDHGFLNSGKPLNLGRFQSGTNYADMYWSQLYIQDGVAGAATDAGEFDDEGEWRPIDVTGLTFGTNGFLLDFAVAPGTGNGAGTDVSGNGNNFTDSGLSAADQVTDTPTNNFCTWNSLDGNEGKNVFSDGNLTNTSSTSAANGGRAFFNFEAPTSGKYYFEITIDTLGVNPAFTLLPGGSGKYYKAGGWPSSYAYINLKESSGGLPSLNNVNYAGADRSQVSYGNSTGFAASDVLGVAWDADNGLLFFSKNDSWFDGDGTDSSATVKAEIEAGTSGSEAFDTSQCGIGDADYQQIMGIWCMSVSSFAHTVNFGQSDFTYTPPSGFSSLSTANMTALDFDVNEHHQVELVNHDGSSTSFTLNWDADTYDTLFIIKNRDNIEKWFWVDGLRGYDKYMSSDETTAETTDANVISVSGTTITLGSSSALSSDNYVIECHRAGDAGGASNTDGTVTGTVSANSVTGFSIALHTDPNDASSYSVGHSLSSTPPLIIAKRRTGTGGWYVNSPELTDRTGYYLKLETNAAEANSAGVWGAGPTATVCGYLSGGLWVGNTPVVTYCWDAVEGYSAFGTYVGNGSSDGPVINLGIKPETLFVKSSSTGGSSYEWNGLYAETNEDVNGAGNGVQWSTDAAESSGNNVDLLSNSAKIRLAGIGFNGSGVTYIYMAWGTPTVDKSETPAKAR